MPLHTTEAFVLRTYSLAEADKICVFLTRQYGKIRGVAHGARRMKSRFGSALEPFTEVVIKYHQKEGQELVSLSSCDIVRSHFNRAARDVETASAFSYMAELLTEFVPDHDPNEKLYRLVGAVLEAIEERENLPPLLRYFEVWLLRLAGFFPDITRCSMCGAQIGPEDSAYVTAEGAPRCESCSGGRGAAVDSALRDTIQELLSVHPRDFARRPLPPQRLAQLGEISYQIVRHALERDLKSRGPLKQFGSA
ncbi:MAG TPA: DNA repair protein RecO [Blastocatellia bacterium]|nr:DNA repair protein RecO [Blastocatellia bacterium]